MKQTTTALLFLSLFLVGCSESSKKSNNNTYGSAYCMQNPWASGCSPYTNGGINGGLYGGVNGGVDPNYCLYYPTAQGCPGYTTGSAGGGNNEGDNSLNSLYGDGNSKPSIPSSITCSAPISRSGLNLDPETASLTMAFTREARDNYSPTLPNLSQFSNNISAQLTNVIDASNFITSDKVFKIRVIPRPQPKPAAGSAYCYGRTTGSGSGVYYGYTQLSYSVSLRVVRPDGTVGPHGGTQVMTTDINKCSPAMTFKPKEAVIAGPNDRVVMVIHDVFSNQGCSYYPCPSSWSQTTTTCWSMDIQVSTDDHKDIQ